MVTVSDRVNLCMRSEWGIILVCFVLSLRRWESCAKEFCSGLRERTYLPFVHPKMNKLICTMVKMTENTVIKARVCDLLTLNFSKNFQFIT